MGVKPYIKITRTRKKISPGIRTYLMRFCDALLFRATRNSVHHMTYVHAQARKARNELNRYGRVNSQSLFTIVYG
jgi:hypothetical protein